MKLRLPTIALSLALLTGCSTPERNKWFLGGGIGTSYRQPEQYGSGLNIGRTIKAGPVGVDVIPLNVGFDPRGVPSYGPLLLFRYYFP